MAREGTVAEVATIPVCDFCKQANPEATTPADFDGKTKQGPWANMCSTHYGIYGVGLGLGRGQRLVLAVKETAEDKRPMFQCPVHQEEHRLDALRDCFEVGILVIADSADPYAHL